jgi:Protein of unknown function (DUF3298).
MKRFFALTLCLLVAATLCACDQQKDAPPPQPPEQPAESPAEVTESQEENFWPAIVEIPVDPDLIVLSDLKTAAFDQDTRAELAAGRLRSSYEIVQTQSYEDKWLRTYESYLPKFSDEITLGGAEPIKAYFEAAAQQEQAAMAHYLEIFGITDTLIDSAGEREHYYYCDYAVAYAEPYLAVRYSAFTYSGGAHGLHYVGVDNFDMRTGQFLALADVFSDWDAAIPVLNESINEKVTQELFEPVDLQTLQDLPFQITSEGIVFVFNEYTIAAYAAGTIEISIPYAELNGLLAIDPPAAHG